MTMPPVIFKLQIASVIMFAVILGASISENVPISAALAALLMMLSAGTLMANIDRLIIASKQ